MGLAAAAWPDKGAALMSSRTLRGGNDCLRSLRLVAIEVSMSRILKPVWGFYHRFTGGIITFVPSGLMFKASPSQTNLF